MGKRKHFFRRGKKSVSSFLMSKWKDEIFSKIVKWTGSNKCKQGGNFFEIVKHAEFFIDTTFG